ncbi:hypothetical protein ACFW04_014044 [Cataglyphis niger]
MATLTHSAEENIKFEGKRAYEYKKERVAFVFYDFETRQDETLEGTTTVKRHIPTLCVAQQICEECAKENDMSVRCRWCGIREFIFRHDPVKQFVDFSTGTTKCFKQIICIAHNAKAFDAQFILKHIVENRDNLEPKIILNRTKIIVLTVGHTKFIDSVNYMPMRLSELPKAFGLQDTSDKGIFPHLFNTVENQSYIGPVPDAHYYSPKTIKSEERERFLTWHTDMRQKNAVFDFQREIVRYCRTNVDILRRACMAFRKIFIDCGNVGPFEECTIIASMCMTVFQKNFLYLNTIGVIPAAGYRKASNYSQLGHSMNHAGCAREYRTVDGTVVDGYYKTSNGATQRIVLLSTSDCNDTIDSRYERTLAITWQLQQRGYLVTEKWECVFDMRDNHEMHEYLENHPMMEMPPLDPRDAFFGGRYGYGENMLCRKYVMCSLYPYVLKTGAFPIGHPDIYVDECSTLIGSAPNYNFDRLEGLIRCKILPPRDLFPVLPYRVKGKLLFALCRSYCETFSQTSCTHENASEREFAQFDRAPRRGGLFAEYINTFSKFKQEASGWPNKCGENDYDAKEQYLREYEETEDIVLDRCNVAWNPGLRCRKIVLKFFLGKIRSAI